MLHTLALEVYRFDSGCNRCLDDAVGQMPYALATVQSVPTVTSS
jgi:hypothetical protein